MHPIYFLHLKVIKDRRTAVRVLKTEAQSTAKCETINNNSDESFIMKPSIHFIILFQILPN